MRVAVTGGTGYLGAHVVRSLLTAGHEVRLMVAPGEQVDKLVVALSELGPVEQFAGDVRSPDVVRSLLEGCDAVIHAAGVVGTDDRRAELMWEVNAYAAESVLRSAVDLGLDPVVLVSSYAVFTPTDDPVINLETATAEARSAYGQSKAHAERYARTLQDEGAPVVITYPSSVVGPAFHTNVGITEQGWSTITRARWAPRVHGGMPMVDVCDIGEVHSRIVDAGPGHGPRRYLCGGLLMPFDGMVDAVENGMGRKVRRIPLSPGLFRAIGRAADSVGRWVPISGGFSRDAAELLTAATPTDDRETLADLQMQWRSPAEAIVATFS
ncbi:NAD-dependent epimerase/dehydratase family protein [Tomitella biformata]|uniref:NAD-dependent epimerase/dehydratase family protein n=1 Tax=Tomitella biformata TaxID=630403 RepID=UPI000462EBD6|nr:NAD-dependent epimerase/dehydratase family protein [Tomitella biformata]